MNRERTNMVQHLPRTTNGINENGRSPIWIGGCALTAAKAATIKTARIDIVAEGVCVRGFGM